MRAQMEHLFARYLPEQLNKQNAERSAGGWCVGSACDAAMTLTREDPGGMKGGIKTGREEITAQRE